MVDRSVDLGEAGVVVVAAGEEAAVVAEDDVRLLAAHHLDVLLLLQLPRAVPVEVFRLIINPRLDFPTLVDTISAEKEIVLKINPIEQWNKFWVDIIIYDKTAEIYINISLYSVSYLLRRPTLFSIFSSQSLLGSGLS